MSASWLNLALLDTHQAVIRAYVDVAFAFGERGHVRGWQTFREDAPALLLAIVKIESIAQGAGKNVIFCHQHGVGVDFDSRAGDWVGVKLSGTVEPHHTTPVGPDHPFVTDMSDGGNPVLP